MNNNNETAKNTASYGLCCYVPFEDDEGNFTLKSLNVLCGTKIIDEQECLKIFEPFRNFAESNNVPLSYLALVLAAKAEKISNMLVQAAKQLEEKEANK